MFGSVPGVYKSSRLLEHVTFSIQISCRKEGPKSVT